MFDVFSSETLDKVLEEGGAFDSVFYTDQRDSSQRELVIETMRVSKDYYEHWRKIEATKARKFARKLSAFGTQPVTNNLSMGSSDLDYNENESSVPHHSPFKAPADESTSMSRIRISSLTRSSVARSLSTQIENVISLPSSTSTLVDKGIQTS